MKGSLECFLIGSNSTRLSEPDVSPNITLSNKNRISSSWKLWHSGLFELAKDQSRVERRQSEFSDRGRTYRIESNLTKPSKRRIDRVSASEVEPQFMNTLKRVFKWGSVKVENARRIKITFFQSL